MKLTKQDLDQFTGSEYWYNYSLSSKVLYTDGIKYIAEKANAYWLIDEIVLIQPFKPELRKQRFQVWKLKVNEDQSATLSCEDGDYHVLYVKDIPFTDFPFSVSLYFSNNVLLLPSEY